MGKGTCEHPYISWHCPMCGAEICWQCAVKCTDDSTGEGKITCPNCGHQGVYNHGPFYKMWVNWSELQDNEDCFVVAE